MLINSMQCKQLFDSAMNLQLIDISCSSSNSMHCTIDILYKRDLQNVQLHIDSPHELHSLPYFVFRKDLWQHTPGSSLAKLTGLVNMPHASAFS